MLVKVGHACAVTPLQSPHTHICHVGHCRAINLPLCLRNQISVDVPLCSLLAPLPCFLRSVWVQLVFWCPTCFVRMFPSVLCPGTFSVRDVSPFCCVLVECLMTFSDRCSPLFTAFYAPGCGPGPYPSQFCGAPLHHSCR